MNWAEITRAEIIAFMALIVSLLSAFLTGLNYRVAARREQREVAAARPQVDFHIDKQARPNRVVTLNVRNRASAPISLVSVVASRGVSLRLVGLSSSDNPTRFFDQTPMADGRKAALSNFAIEQGDSASLILTVQFPEAERRRGKLMLTWEINISRQLRFTETIDLSGTDLH